MSHEQVQAVHDKLVELDVLVRKAFGACNSLTASRLPGSVEQANSGVRLSGGLQRINEALLGIINEDILGLIINTKEAGAKRASRGGGVATKIEDEIGSGPETVIFAPADLVVTAFEQFGPDAKKEALKRCLDCLNEPSSGEQGAVEAVVAIFKLIEPEERKELFKRLIDL